jgi:hypothetical protein
VRHPAVAFLSHPPATVPAMGLFLSGVVAQLPLLAVVIAGFVVISARRARIGARSALFARLGLALLAVNLVLQGIWTVTFPRLLSSLDMDYSRFGMINLATALILTVMYAGGIGLLVAAVVTRVAPASDPHQFAASPPGAGPFGGPPASYPPPHGTHPPGANPQSTHPQAAPQADPTADPWSAPN